MTSKERMLIAMQNGQPDRVPCAPDISTMIPCRLTGKPFWEICLYERPPLWNAYMDAVRYFGIDGWFIYGRLNFISDSKVETTTRLVECTEGRLVRETVFSTPAGDMMSEHVCFRGDPPTTTVKPVKDLVKDFVKLRYFYPEITGYDATTFEAMRAEVGDAGAFGVTVTYPGFQNWFTVVQGGIEALTYTYEDHPEIFQEWRELEDRRCMRIMEMTLEARPDFILFGGSGSITLQSPALFREFSVPTLKTLSRMAKDAGIPTMLHSCGKERALVEIMAEESDLNCVNPLEPPPMGDCNLAELKRTFGHRLAFMGNLHTTDVMLRGRPEDVERAAMTCIDDAAEGGGYILSTGDQCGRDTPDENIFRLVEVCKAYGRYT